VSFTGGAKIALHAQVHFQCAALEPTATALRQLRWFRDLRNPQRAGVESTRELLAAGRNGKLHMVETHDPHERQFTPASGLA